HASHSTSHTVAHVTLPSSHNFLFAATPPPHIYPLSLHDALPICHLAFGSRGSGSIFCDTVSDSPKENAGAASRGGLAGGGELAGDRKSTRLNSSHVSISYAVFCLKKKTAQLHPLSGERQGYAVLG